MTEGIPEATATAGEGRIRGFSASSLHTPVASKIIGKLRRALAWADAATVFATFIALGANTPIAVAIVGFGGAAKTPGFYDFVGLFYLAIAGYGGGAAFGQGKDLVTRGQNTNIFALRLGVRIAEEAILYPATFGTGISDGHLHNPYPVIARVLAGVLVLGLRDCLAAALEFGTDLCNLGQDALPIGGTDAIGQQSLSFFRDHHIHGVFAILSLGMDIGTGGKQCLDHVEITKTHRPVQGGVLVIFFGIILSDRIDQSLQRGRRGLFGNLDCFGLTHRLCRCGAEGEGEYQGQRA